MTDLDLDAIAARANAATDGPWLIDDEDGGIYTKPVWYEEDGQRYYGSRWITESGANSSDADAEFIAHARTDVPALVAEVRRLREVLADVSAAEYAEPGRLRRILDRAGVTP